MSRSWLRVASVVMATALLSCSSSTEPGGNHVDFERALWLGGHPQSYSYDVTITAFYSLPGPVHVQVSDGQVVAARDSSGKAVANFALTIDDIWDALLAARARNELNSVEFGQRGVPVELDVGTWANDGGTHYSVRNFAASR